MFVLFGYQVSRQVRVGERIANGVTRKVLIVQISHQKKQVIRIMKLNHLGVIRTLKDLIRGKLLGDYFEWLYYLQY